MSPEVAVASTVRWPVSRALARRAAAAVLTGERAADASLALTFVGPARMRSLNQAWFGKDRPTDVIAFNYVGKSVSRKVGTSHLPTYRPTDLPTPSGEVFVCPAIAARNARRFGVSAREETLRLVVHGVLHVLGYDHPAGAERTASPMWRRQERYLARVLRRA